MMHTDMAVEHEAADKTTGAPSSRTGMPSLARSRISSPGAALLSAAHVGSAAPAPPVSGPGAAALPLLLLLLRVPLPLP